jgi:hypothetical protein
MYTLFVTSRKQQRCITSPALGALLFVASHMHTPQMRIRIWDHKHRCFVR